MTAYVSSTSICRYISAFSTCALKLSIGNKKTCIHKYAMKTHSSGVFTDGCSGHLPREILTT